MNDKVTASLLFATGILVGVGITSLSLRSAMFEQDKTIANLEAEVKVKPIITVEGLGICQVTQGGKVYMLVDITEEMQATDAVDEIGLEEKHNQLMENYETK